jgi:hypothetical protein
VSSVTQEVPSRTIIGITLGLLIVVFASASRAQVPEYLWSLGIGSTGNDEAFAVAVDASGNVVVVGYFSGTVNFGSGNLVSNAGSNDIFVAKYNANGVPQWSQRFGSTSDDAAWAVAGDGSGNVFVTGYFSGTVNFGGVNLVSAGNFDIFVAKYSANGAHQWSQRFGGTDIELGTGVAATRWGMWW